MKVKVFLWLVWMLPFHTICIFGQGGQSPYTFQGIGEINSPELTNNIGMGGIGISNGSLWHLNNKNPALLSRNSFSVFEMAANADLRQLQSGSLKQKNAAGQLSYLALGIPVKKHWTMSLGYSQLSNVNYSILTSETLLGGTAETQYDGNGGIYQAYISNGFKITNNLSAGIKGSYLFGPIVSETIVTIDQNQNNQTVLKDRLSFSDVSLGLGLAYEKPLKEGLDLSFGFTYDLPTSVNARRLSITERRIITGAVVTSDTLADGVKGSVKLPNRFGWGASIQKLNKWTAGLDIEVQQWSDYRDFDGNTSELDNSFRISVGGEFTPDLVAIAGYFKRVTYRLGFSYEQTPFLLNNEQIKDFGINFGTSFPVSRFSNLNLGVRMGQRGSNNNDLIKEQYLKIYFGISFNDFAWKKRPIYD